MTPFNACLLKLAAEVTREQAEGALNRLESIEAGRPTGKQMLRGALIGAAAGPIASNVSKVIGKGEFHTPREIAGQIAGGLVTGTAIPWIKNEVEARAEKKLLSDYLANARRNQLAKRIETKLEPIT